MASHIPLATARKSYRRLLLDTTVLIDSYQKHLGREHPDLLPSLRGIDLACSIVSSYEFLKGGSGRKVGDAEARERRQWLRSHQITSISLDEACSTSFESLISHECPPGLGDTLIAATCIAKRVPLVTGNARHFEAVQQLNLVDVPIA